MVNHGAPNHSNPTVHSVHCGQPVVRVQVRITGAVQGVGFRPYVFRLAREWRLSGWVVNSAQGVRIEAQGAAPDVEGFLSQLRDHPPPHAVVAGFEATAIPEQTEEGFEVRPSDPGGEPAAFLLPDLASCPECLREIRDPANRRFRYPFTTCTHCGPRYSIVEGIPYDRPLTSMRHFPMCPACEREYRDPSDRRFHAQTNACPDCGPHLAIWDSAGRVLAERAEALAFAAACVRRGEILAMKGLGGFHLICDARNPGAIRLLRERKRRPTKPFAIMAPDFERARKLCVIDRAAADLLASPQAPIVLLPRASACDLPADLAPGNPYLGLMLPYTPLHALLLDELGFPIVATSGNLSDDPICFDEREALERLRAIAGVFLVHNRPILRPVDDSVARFMNGRAVLLRRARGYAPLPLDAGRELPELFATGAHMKNTVAFSRGRLIFVSQHIGDLETLAGAASHERAARDFLRVYGVQPLRVAHDLHPDYGSTRSARQWGVPLAAVQHHKAHVLASMAEHRLEPPVLGVSWDGAGYGEDGKVWGGEFFLFDGRQFEHIGRFRPFRLPGGEQAVKEPRRSLLGVLAVMGRAGDARSLFTELEWRVVTAALGRGLNAPWTTSAGRLFDAAAALVGLHAKTSFEGEAAMGLEFAAARARPSAADPPRLPFDNGIVDWEPLFTHLAASPDSVSEKAWRFHAAMANVILDVARACRVPKVTLAGGCFQNALLTELAVERLRQAGFQPYTSRALPPNDGAISVGQICGAALEVESCVWQSRVES